MFSSEFYETSPVVASVSSFKSKYPLFSNSQLFAIQRPISVWLKCLYVDYQKAFYICGLLSKMSFFRNENSKITKVFWYDLTCIYWTEIKFFCELSVIIKTTTRGVSKTLPGWWNLFANKGKNLIAVIFQGSKYPANIYLLKVNNINTRKKC